MKNYYDKSFQMRYFEMNKFGEARPTVLLTLLQETAADHCHSIGYSLYDLENQNIGWVLFAGVMKIDRYPTYKEKITIRTWLSSYSNIRGYRENNIYDESGAIIGCARGLWVFFDIKKRRPVPIYKEFEERWSCLPEECVDVNIIKKIVGLNANKHVSDFTIHRYDTDTNLHVNNIRYLQWLMESVPSDYVDDHYLHMVDGRFMAEAKYGDTIQSFIQDDETKDSFFHEIRTQSNDKICAKAKTIWRPRVQ